MRGCGLREWSVREGRGTLGSVGGWENGER